MTATRAAARDCPVRWARALACLQRTSSAISATVCSDCITFPFLHRDVPLYCNTSNKHARIAAVQRTRIRHRRSAPSKRYYEEVRIIPEDSRSGSGTLMGVGPGLCELRRIILPRTPLNREREGLESRRRGTRPYPARCIFSGRTISTGQWAWRTTESETLPISARLTPPKPRLPITISPAPSSSAKWMMA
jgi:hypothetical protein